MEVLFLALDDIVAFHEAHLHRFGGAGGLLNPAALESAVAAPRAVATYLDDADLFDLAAAYAYHLTQAHAFLDGNKRTAFLATLIFLQVNGQEIPDAADQPVRELILAIAAGHVDRAEAAAILRDVFSA